MSYDLLSNGKWSARCNERRNWMDETHPKTQTKPPISHFHFLVHDVVTHSHVSHSGNILKLLDLAQIVRPTFDSFAMDIAAHSPSLVERQLHAGIFEMFLGNPSIHRRLNG